MLSEYRLDKKQFSNQILIKKLLFKVKKIKKRL